MNCVRHSDGALLFSHAHFDVQSCMLLPMHAAVTGDTVHNFELEVRPLFCTCIVSLGP